MRLVGCSIASRLCATKAWRGGAMDSVDEDWRSAGEALADLEFAVSGECLKQECRVFEGEFCGGKNLAERFVCVTEALCAQESFQRASGSAGV